MLLYILTSCFLLGDFVLVEQLSLNLIAVGILYFSHKSNISSFSCNPSANKTPMFFWFFLTICLATALSSISSLPTRMSITYFFPFLFFTPIIITLIHPFFTFHFSLIHPPLFVDFSPEPSDPTSR